MKKFKLLLLLPLLAVATVGVQSCSDDDDVFNASVTMLSFDSETLVKTFNISSNVGWVITSSTTWCTVNPTSGSGDAEITVTVTENEDINNSRPATITLTPTSGNPITIEVIQLAGDSKPAVVKEESIDVSSSWGKWNYFSFETGEIVGVGTADATTDAEWKARTDWDIAFTRLYARTNSGVSGNGLGGVIEIQPSETNKDNVFAQLTVAPTEGYVEDETISTMFSMPPAYYDAGGASTINPWLTMSMPVVVTPKVFVVKTASGKYVKLYLKAYQNEAGTSGHIQMEYAYQADGSTNLMTE